MGMRSRRVNTPMCGALCSVGAIPAYLGTGCTRRPRPDWRDSLLTCQQGISVRRCDESYVECRRTSSAADHPQRSHLCHARQAILRARLDLRDSTTTAFRCLVCKHGDVVRLESRRGRDMSDQFPELVSEIRPIPQDFVADGELVVLDDQGRPQWDRLHSRHTLRHLHRIREAATRDPAAIFAFDLLWLNGCDFRDDRSSSGKRRCIAPCQPIGASATHVT